MGQLPRPLSAKELEALRKKAAPNTESAPVTAESIAYESGIRSLGSVVLRVEALERKTKELEEKVQVLELEHPLESV